MTGSTAVNRALDCLQTEQEAVADRGDAFETFKRRVQEVPAESPIGGQRQQPTGSTPTAMATPVQTQQSTPSEERCLTVRAAFAETVRPHSIADRAGDESLVETIAAELTEDIAVALATETGWTPALKTAVLEEITTRQREVELLGETLRSERATLEGAIEDIDDILGWLQSTAAESLLQCDFETLRAKHEQLEAYRERLDALTAERQAQFTESTNRYGRGGTRHRTLIPAIYSDLDVQYPVLSSAARLYGICGDCQRTVRAHLTRRV
ncbi:DUF7260 family protein [Natrinema ejinorense]|uniref:DUF7260 domain-containing protein n=1 Tax=Natrinema ejinorense TaxID=373386 RepID=A0A2A5QYV0_9EURY|nr:hypothetical protein [Natrinema ejinorense]PCR92038.1 hypothetical protein CP557_16815 [Natrinema ejinorense]